MPTYQYSCTECGHFLEQFQAFTDDALTECPVCGGRLRKVFNAVGVVFKGSGFYRNDSRSGGPDGGGSGSGSGETKKADAKESSSGAGGSTSDGAKKDSSTKSSGTKDGSTGSSSTTTSSGGSGSKAS